MKTASKIAVLLLLVLTAGCRHKTKVVLPLQTQAPPVAAPPATSTAPPQLPTSAPPQVQLEKTPPPEPKPKPKRKHHKDVKPEEQNQAPAPETPTTAAAQQAATAQQETAKQSAGNSPIGQLTTSGDTTSHENSKEITNLLDSTEKGLDGIKRPLKSEEQVTATQIRSFLTKARQALGQGDLDGAHTLGTKAKVLLDELTKPQ